MQVFPTELVQEVRALLVFYHLHPIGSTHLLVVSHLLMAPHLLITPHLLGVPHLVVLLPTHNIPLSSDLIRVLVLYELIRPIFELLCLILTASEMLYAIRTEVEVPPLVVSFPPTVDHLQSHQLAPQLLVLHRLLLPEQDCPLWHPLPADLHLIARLLQLMALILQLYLTRVALGIIALPHLPIEGDRVSQLPLDVLQTRHLEALCTQVNSQ
jgi:hypothetical protein